jgi:hypothetical protein
VTASFKSERINTLLNRHPDVPSHPLRDAMGLPESVAINVKEDWMPSTDAVAENDASLDVLLGVAQKAAAGEGVRRLPIGMTEQQLRAELARQHELFHTLANDMKTHLEKVEGTTRLGWQDMCFLMFCNMVSIIILLQCLKPYAANRPQSAAQLPAQGPPPPPNPPRVPAVVGQRLERVLGIRGVGGFPTATGVPMGAPDRAAAPNRALGALPSVTAAEAERRRSGADTQDTRATREETALGRENRRRAAGGHPLATHVQIAGPHAFFTPPLWW